MYSITLIKKMIMNLIHRPLLVIDIKELIMWKLIFYYLNSREY